MPKSDIATEQDMTSALILSFHRFWQERREGGPVPDRAHFTPENLLPWIGQIQIVDVIDGGRDFYHRIVGTGIVTMVGRDLSRKYVSESEYRIGTDAMLLRYREAMARAAPIFRKGSMIWALNSSWIPFESITAPVSLGRGAVDQLVTVIDFPKGEWRAED